MSGEYNYCHCNPRAITVRQDLTIYLLISITIHLIFLSLYVQVTEFQMNEAISHPAEGTSELKMVIVGNRGFDISNKPTSDLAEPSTGIRKEKIRSVQASSNPKLLPDATPELISDISLEIDDFRAAGFAILALDVDARGIPDSADVIYSELPLETTDVLIKRFSAAKFRPAVKGGQATAASVLIRIDVE